MPFMLQGIWTSAEALRSARESPTSHLRSIYEPSNQTLVLEQPGAQAEFILC